MGFGSWASLLAGLSGGKEQRGHAGPLFEDSQVFSDTFSVEPFSGNGNAVSDIFTIPISSGGVVFQSPSFQVNRTCRRHNPNSHRNVSPKIFSSLIRGSMSMTPSGETRRTSILPKWGRSDPYEDIHIPVPLSSPPPHAYRLGVPGNLCFRASKSDFRRGHNEHHGLCTGRKAFYLFFFTRSISSSVSSRPKLRNPETRKPCFAARFWISFTFSTLTSFPRV